jgi:hypothetical protein
MPRPLLDGFEKRESDFGTPRNFATQAFVLLTIAALMPIGLSAQSFQRPSVGIRIGQAFHIAGLERSLKPELGLGRGASWQHRVEPATAIGATVSTAYGSGLFGLRVDGDLVRRADIRRDPAGPRLINPTSGKSYWVSGSATMAPTIVCRRRCVRLSAGLGHGYYDYAVRELRGDIANPWALAQRTTSARLGVDAVLPVLRRHVVVEVADYIGRLEHGYRDGERLSPMHTLVVSLGLRAGP